MPLVGSQNPVKDASRIRPKEFPDRVHGVGDALFPDFTVPHLGPGLPAQTRSQHGQPGEVARHRPDTFQGGLCAWDKNNLPKPIGLPGGAGDEEMAEVEGVKGSPEQTDPPPQKMLRSTWILSLGRSRMSRLGSAWISLALNSLVTPLWVNLTFRRLAKSVNPPQAATAPRAVKSLV